MKPFEKIVGRGKNAGNQPFLLFAQYILLFLKQTIRVTSILLSANALSLDWSTILYFGKEFI